MFKLANKWWKYLTAKLTGTFNERADPKVQLEQAIAEAQDAAPAAEGAGGQRHRQPEAGRDAAQRQDGRAREAERQRPPGADHGGRRRRRPATPTKAAQYNSAAETIANQLIQVEKDVESLKTMVLESTQASDQAKAAVAAEQPHPAAEDRREVEAAQPARAGEDAGRDEHGDGAAQRDASATTCRR